MNPSRALYNSDVKDIFETVTDGFFTVDREWKIKYWNEQAEQLVGIKKEEIIGESLWKIFETRMTLNFFSEYHRAFEENIPVFFKQYFPPYNSWFQLTAYPSGDMLLIFFKSLNDRESEGSFTMSEEDRYRYVYNNCAPSIVIWNINDFKILDINEAAIELHGYSKFEAQSMTIFDLIHKQDYGIVNDLCRQTATDEKLKYITTCRHIKKSRELIFMEVSFNRIIYRGFNAIMVLGHNITDKIALENELTKEKGLMRKQIIESVIMAHEKQRANIGKALHENVNQILGSVKLYIDCAITDPSNRDDLLTRSSNYLRNAIDEISKLSRALDTSELNDLSLKDSIKIFTQDIIRKHSLKIRCKFNNLNEWRLGKNLKVNIFRIVEEQLTNIIEHAKASIVCIDFIQFENEISVMIRDNGIGYDTDKQQNGMGITNIIGRTELYNGRISINSAPGKGCRLQILFPLITKNRKTSTKINKLLFD